MGWDGVHSLSPPKNQRAGFLGVLMSTSRMHVQVHAVIQSEATVDRQAHRITSIRYPHRMASNHIISDQTPREGRRHPLLSTAGPSLPDAPGRLAASEEGVTHMRLGWARWGEEYCVPNHGRSRGRSVPCSAIYTVPTRLLGQKRSNPWPSRAKVSGGIEITNIYQSGGEQ